MAKTGPKPKKLPHPDAHFLDAAVGWIELGSPREALKELDQIAPELQKDPQVLEVRWQVFARTDSWEKSLPVAREFCQAAPGVPQGWLHQAVSLYRLNRTQEAWDLLLPFAQKFPLSWIIPYDLSCYACQLGKIAEGRRWLGRAFHLGDAKEVKLLALADPDLKILWPEIQSGQWDNSSDASAEPAEPAK